MNDASPRRKGSKEVVDIEFVRKAAANAHRTMSKYHSGRPLEKDYLVQQKEVLGKGYSGPVVLCTGKHDNKKYALKAFSKSKKSADHFELLVNEAQVYLTLDHPNVTRLVHVYEDKDSVFLVMEYCAGGELFERLAEKVIFPEKEAVEATKQMLRAVAYLHSHGIFTGI
jgi:serine/threonine protein kinase